MITNQCTIIFCLSPATNICTHYVYANTKANTKYKIKHKHKRKIHNPWKAVWCQGLRAANHFDFNTIVLFTTPGCYPAARQYCPILEKLFKHLSSLLTCLLFFCRARYSHFTPHGCYPAAGHCRVLHSPAGQYWVLACWAVLSPFEES